MNQPVLFIYRKMKEDDKVSRAKNPKYESMSPEELKANMEKSRQELEVAIHNKKPSGAEEKVSGTQGTLPPADCQRGRV